MKSFSCAIQKAFTSLLIAINTYNSMVSSAAVLLLASMLGIG
jgi:hypothetical protein